MKWLVLVVAIAGSGTLLAQTTTPTFDVASIKLNRSGASGIGATTLIFQPDGRFTAINEPLWRLIAEAYRSTYQLRRFEIEGIPPAMDNARFDVDAVPQGTPNSIEQRQMLQQLLADRFKLRLHRETRDVPVYALVKARADGRLGERLKPSDVDCAAVRAGAPPLAPTPGQPPSCMMIFGQAFDLLRHDADPTGGDGVVAPRSATRH